MRVVWCWYALHVLAVVAVIAGVLIANDPPANVGLALGLSLWLGTFATSSILVVTAGLTGVYERTSPVLATKAVAGGIAGLTGLPLYGLGLVSTPILVLLGVLLRLAVIGIQRLLGLRLAPDAPDEAAHDQGAAGDAGPTVPRPSAAPAARHASSRTAGLITVVCVSLVVGGGLALGRAIPLPNTDPDPPLQVSVLSYSVDQSDDPVVRGQTTVNEQVEIRVVNKSSRVVTLHPLTDIGIYSGDGFRTVVGEPPSGPLSAAANPDPEVVRQVRLSRRQSTTFTLVFTTSQWAESTHLSVTLNGSTFSVKL